MKNILLVILIGLLSKISSCENTDAEFKNIRGYIFGATYNIVYENNKKITPDSLKKEIEKVLHDYEKSLSSYDETSLISRINRNEDVKVDVYIEEIYRNSVKISEMSGGAFDITVGPLVRAWGFGADRQKDFNEQKLDSLLNLVGMDKIKLVDGKILKTNPDIVIDFNAIAKGFAVDIVARYINSLGIKNYLVEIGGEIRTRGTKNGNLWNIGIDKPEESNFMQGQLPLQAVVRITDKSMATSGNYRRFYIEDGVKYSHTIDPKTGYPIKNRMLSATVLAAECGIADGIATVCMVLGPEKAKEFIDSHPEFSAFIIYSGPNGEFEMWMSESLKEYITEVN
jgi:thiamine biosynthesis lipoprotein